MEPSSFTRPSRRRFLETSAVAACVCAAWTPSIGRSALLLNDAGVVAEPWFEVSLAEWSLHNTLFEKKMTNLDFPTVAKEKFGISAVEYVNQFFKDKAKDVKYLAELNQRCDDAGVESVLIMVDGEGELGHADKGQRRQAVENHHQWVSAAKELGCHSIRVNASSSGSYREQVNLAADGLRRLSEFAATHDINVIVENHGGLSSNGQWLAQVISRVNLDNCGTLPDFGNFVISDRGGPNEVAYDRYLGVAAMLPFAKAVSAKSHSFDDAGNETATDYLKMLQLVKDSGYRGHIGVEYEGSDLSEADGIKKTRDLLLKCRGALA